MVFSEQVRGRRNMAVLEVQDGLGIAYERCCPLNILID